jgi:hypothetical protein
MVFTGLIFPWNGMVMWKISEAIGKRVKDSGGGERRVEKRVEINIRRGQDSNGNRKGWDERLSDRELVVRWTRLNFGKDVLMVSAGLVGGVAFAGLPAWERTKGWWIG